MKKIKIGQIGLGHWGTRHCHALMQIPNADLCGVYDLNSDLCKHVSQSLRLRAFPDLDSLLGEVEAVTVAVPTFQHFQTVSSALAHGVSVFVEKPITACVTEAEGLVALADSKQLTLQVGHIERFNPAVLAFKKIEHVKPHYIECRRLVPFDGRGGDVSVVLDLMIHDLDLILSFAQNEVEDIESVGFSMITPEIDFANANVRFKNGCLANITASRIAANRVRQMSLYEKDRSFGLDFWKRQAKVCEPENYGEQVQLQSKDREQSAVRKKTLHDLHIRDLPCEATDPLKEELKDFVNAIRNGVLPVVDGRQGLRALRFACQIIDNMRSQKRLEY